MMRRSAVEISGVTAGKVRLSVSCLLPCPDRRPRIRYGEAIRSDQAFPWLLFVLPFSYGLKDTLLYSFYPRNP
jgi:hypothetical protein